MAEAGGRGGRVEVGGEEGGEQSRGVGEGGAEQGPEGGERAGRGGVWAPSARRLTQRQGRTNPTPLCHKCLKDLNTYTTTFWFMKRL